MTSALIASVVPPGVTPSHRYPPHGGPVRRAARRPACCGPAPAPLGQGDRARSSDRTTPPGSPVPRPAPGGQPATRWPSSLQRHKPRSARRYPVRLRRPETGNEPGIPTSAAGPLSEFTSADTTSSRSPPASALTGPRRTRATSDSQVLGLIEYPPCEPGLFRRHRPGAFHLPQRPSHRPATHLGGMAICHR